VENLSLKAMASASSPSTIAHAQHPARAVEAGIRLVTLVSDVPAAPRSAYVGIDNRVAGRPRRC